MKTLRVLTLVGAFLLLAGSRSGATPLNLQEPVNPTDFFSDTISINYVVNNGTGAFSATGYTETYTNGSVSIINQDYDDWSFDLTATITSAGVLTNGSLTLMGDVGNGTENLLTGKLTTGADGTAFGSDTTGYGQFEFLFTVTGGNTDVVKDFNGIGATGGLLLYPWFSPPGDTPFNGSWADNFNSNYSAGGEADTWAVVPEPSSILLVLLGGVVCGIAHRATTKKQARSA
jgi:hypothetical protein